MADENSSISGMGWFLAGLGVGALVGVLYAPKSGRETREDLVSGALEARDKATVLAQQGKEKAAQLQVKAQEQITDYVDRGKQYYERGRTQFSEYVDKGKDLVQEQQDKVAAAIEAGKDAYVSTTSESAHS